MATPRDITVRLQAVLDRGGRNGASSNDIESCLIEIWLDDYAHGRSTEQVVRVQAQGFNYLFDIATERLIAAWGLSRGANHAPRPEARMRGFPLSAGPLFHRGHAIAHQLGGGTDINLVAQRGRINVGPFRELEREAVINPGAFYFSNWLYAPMGEIPTGVLQGLILPGGQITIRQLPN